MLAYTYTKIVAESLQKIQLAFRNLQLRYILLVLRPEKLISKGLYQTIMNM
jgi:hypothetical protein